MTFVYIAVRGLKTEIPDARFGALLDVQETAEVNYVYGRVNQPDALGVLYLTLGGSVIVNVDDGSYPLLSEVQYKATENLELRWLANISAVAREPNLARSKQTCGSKSVFDISSESTRLAHPLRGQLQLRGFSDLNRGV